MAAIRGNRIGLLVPLYRPRDNFAKLVALPALRLDQHHPRRLHEQNPQVAIAPPGYLAQDRTVPGRDLLGASPSQAAKSRPLVNTSPAPIAATVALEMIGPMPGTLISRSQPASWRAIASISFESLSTRSSSRRPIASQVFDNPHHAGRQNVRGCRQYAWQLGAQKP